MTPGTRRLLLAATVTLAALGLLLAGSWLWLNRDTSTYAPGFTDSGFSKIREGMTAEQVRSLLGEPLSMNLDPARETWFYLEDQPNQQQKEAGVFKLFGSLGRVEFDPQGRVAGISGDGLKGLRVGLSREEVLRLLGPPSNKQPARAKTLHYSSPGNAGIYRARALELDEKDRVTRIIHYTIHD
jgi:outer membrane protein assembly factor BamE (lipoprotein component of BamABCDE complex)